MHSVANLNWIPIAYFRDGRVTLYLSLLAALPLLGYHFGGGNQVEQFPIIARMIDPEFAAGDFYIDNAVGFGPRFYYSQFMAIIVGATSFPIAVLVLSLLSNLATGAITYFATRRYLNADALAGAVAATLAVVNSGFALGLAGYIRFESFQPASIAIPISLVAIHFAFSGRLMIAASLFALSSLFHPLIGVEIGLISFGAYFLATIFEKKMSKQLIRELLQQVGAGVVFVALVFMAWGVPSLMSASEKIPDQEFFDILIAFRSPHHYLALEFPRAQYVSFILFCVGIATIIIHYWRTIGLQRPIPYLLIAALMVFILCAASIIFVDMLESRIYATAQVFRLLFLFKWVGYLFIGWMISRWAAKDAALGLVFAALILLSVGEAQPRALTLIMFLAWMSGTAFFDSRFIAKWSLAVVGFAGVAFLHGKFGSGTQILRAVVAIGFYFVIFKLPLNRKIAMATATAMMAGLIVFISINRTEGWIDKRTLKPEYNWEDLTGPDANIARWVRANTPEGAIFSTPPDFDSFRMVAERGIIVDHKSIPFGDLALREWEGTHDHPLWSGHWNRSQDCWRNESQLRQCQRGTYSDSDGQIRRRLCGD